MVGENAIWKTKIWRLRTPNKNQKTPYAPRPNESGLQEKTIYKNPAWIVKIKRPKNLQPKDRKYEKIGRRWEIEIINILLKHSVINKIWEGYEVIE